MLVFAHGIVGRADLPIPEALFGAAAAAVLVLSFLALAAGWSQPRLEHVRERPLFRIPLAVEVACGAIGVAVFAVVVYAGLAGTDSQQDNLAPTAVYVGFWVAVPLLSLLIGDWFRLFNPWRALGRATGWIAGRLSRGEPTEVFPYPERLGQLARRAGILAFVICELCWATGREPGAAGDPDADLRVRAARGPGRLRRRGVVAPRRRVRRLVRAVRDAVGAAPARQDGRVVLRPPFAGAARLSPGRGHRRAARDRDRLDRLRRRQARGRCSTTCGPTCRTFFTSLGASLGFGLELAYVVGLLVAIGMVGALWFLGTLGMPQAGSGGLDRKGLSRRFAHTLVPIAGAYVVAHYFSLLAYNGQDLWRLASDPLGDGSDLFGGAGASIDYSVLTRDGDLVRAGARARRGPRRRARARPRPRARRLRIAEGGGPLADRHAGADGLLHLPRPVAALGRAERIVDVLVFAHAGHWLPS